MVKVFRPSTAFKRQLKRVPSDVVKKLRKVIEQMEIDEFAPLLHNHKLKGEYSDYRSVNITGDWRLMYEKTMTDEYILVQIGTHSELYK